MNADDRMITEHFSWQEAFRTDHREIDNTTPDGNIHINIAKTAVKLEKVRALLGAPVSVNSWYRNLALNTTVGGSKTSDHMTGSAVDFVSPRFGSSLDICKRIIADAAIIGFKQLILEHSWVHISWAHIPGVKPKLEVLSLLNGGRYAIGLTDKLGNRLE